MMRWTPEIDTQLRKLWKQEPELSIHEISALMGLRFEQVRHRRRQLGLPNRRETRRWDGEAEKGSPAMLGNRDEEHVANCLAHGGFGVLNTKLFVPGTASKTTGRAPNSANISAELT